MPVNALDIDIKDTNATGIENISEENKNSEISSETTIQDNVSEIESENDSSSIETEIPNNENLITTENEENSLPIEEEKTTPNGISLQSDAGEDNEEEPSTDNWELGLVFYDSTVDNGKTPLTSIDWDASDGGYGEGDTRVITVQINYKNTNAVTTYEPGELGIEIPNLIYNTAPYKGSSSTRSSRAQWNSSVVVGANDATHTGYDWDLKSNNNGKFIFTNNKLIDEKSNFEGSIQIVYTITPTAETYNNMYYDGWDGDTLELYQDECTHTLDKDLQVTLNYPDKSGENQTAKNLLSDKGEFHYTRTYIHPWTKPSFTLNKSASKITSYDGMGENPEDYIWVKYGFSRDELYRSQYPNVSMRRETTIIYDTFPKECKVVSSSGKELEPSDVTVTLPTGKELKSNDSELLYVLPNNLGSILYVGYPKVIYNKENGNLNFTNTAYYYGRYSCDKELSYLATDSVNINLENFEFNYSGQLYGIKKYGGMTYTTYYQNIIEKGGFETDWRLSVTAIYSGHPMTVKWGDDVLYITDKDGDYVKLEDNEYCITSISAGDFYNANNIKVSDYKSQLWVRYANDKEYTLYEDSTTNEMQLKSWNFEESDNIVGYYFMIFDMKESLTQWNARGCKLKCKKTDIPQKGNLYNFGYIQAFFKDSQGNLILQNEPGLSSYGNYITKEKIAAFDKETYGTYMQRATEKGNWSYYTPPTYSFPLCIRKKKETVTQDVQNERFLGSFYLSCSHSTYGGTDVNTKYMDFYTKNDVFDGFIMYDLLPEGMELTSTADDIRKSIGCAYINNDSAYQDGRYDHYDYQSDYTHYHSGYNNYIDYSKYTFLKLDGTHITQEEIKNYAVKNSEVTITENWNDTGRTMIKISTDLSELDLLSFRSLGLYYRIDYAVSYDSFLEYGNVYKNKLYVDYLNKKTNQSFHYTVKGEKDILDINENGNTNDSIHYNESQVVITSVVSSHQDVQTQVQTVNDNFTVGKGSSPYNEEYTYKLRVRTGQNAATNMVIANNLEMAYRDKKFWQGEFKEIDTSYIENKTWMVYDPKDENANSEGYVPKKIVVKPYYSTDPEETDLYLTEQTTVTEDGNEVSKTIFKMDSDGNIVKNTSWKEYDESIDKSTVKSLAFELLDAETGKPSVIPANSLLYVLVKMQAPADPYEGDDTIDQSKRPLPKDIKTYAYNNCWTQWNPIDATFNTKVDFVTGIHSNIVRVALPYTIEDEAVINLSFIKAIDGTEEAFDKMNLNKDDAYKFQITLANQETGDIIKGILDSKTGLQIKEIPIGTYLIKESDDMYFDFVDMTADMVDGIILENTDDGYILSIDNTISEDTRANGSTAPLFEITVNNKIEPDRPYEDKKEKLNLFGF